MGYDDTRIWGIVLDMGSEVLIPPRSCRKTPIEKDRNLYRARHAVEDLFARLNHLRSVATRYDKAARNCTAMVAIGCLLIWLELQG